jgi:hypothetical protein
MINELVHSNGNCFIIRCSDPISNDDIERVYKSAKFGHMSSLVPYMRGIAFRCAGFKLQNGECVGQTARLDLYRKKLGTFLLNKSDISHKTVLHFAIDSMSTKKLN